MTFIDEPARRPPVPRERPRVSVDRERRVVTLHIGGLDERPYTRQDRVARRESLHRLFDKALAEFGNEFTVPVAEPLARRSA